MPMLIEPDAIDLAAAIVHASPADIASWPVTTALERITMRPGQDQGLSLRFAANQLWPDYTPPGWEGPIQYTVWAGVFVDGQWHIAGFIQMWRTRPSTGAPILAQWNSDWAYDANRWGAMCRFRPKPGDRMAFFVSAGNARRGSAGPEGNVTSVRERSNVVLVELPAGDQGEFAFAGEAAAPSSPSPATPPPEAAPVTQGGQGVTSHAADLATVLAEIRKLSDQVQALAETVKSFRTPV